MNKKKIFILILLSMLLVLGPEEIMQASFLRLHILKKCYSPQNLGDSEAMMKQEGVSKHADQMVINDGLNKLRNFHNIDEKLTISKISHHIHFAFSDVKQNINEFYMALLTTSFNKLNQASTGWKHYIWTNKKSIFPQEITNIPGVIVKDLKEFQNHELYPYIARAIDEANLAKSTAYFVEASDLTRLIVVQKYGGVYADMDYDIYNANALEKYLKKFDFIGGRETFAEHSYYGSAFFAAKPNHPIINYAVLLALRNHNLDKYSKVPDYIKYPCNEIDRMYFGSPPLITLAYFAKNNINNNRDIILPAFMVYYASFARTKIGISCDYSKITKETFLAQEGKLKQLLNDYLAKYPVEKIKTANIYFNHQDKDRISYDIIGADMFCGKWMKSKKELKQQYYWNY